MFADRLVLNMQSINDPSTQATSSLVFGKETGEVGISAGYPNDEDATMVQEESTHSQAMEMNTRRID